MDIDVIIKGNKAEVVIDGNIDVDGGIKMTKEFHSIMENGSVTEVTLDLSTVKAITSSAIGKLLKLYKFFEAKKGKMEIIDISDILLNQFNEIHLERIIPINKD